MKKIQTKLQEYIKNNLDTNVYVNFSKARYNLDQACCLQNAQIEDICEEQNITQYINDNKEESNFQKVLFNFIDERHLKDSEVYNKVHLDRRLFSKIRSDVNYHPSKETVILLGLALELNEKEIEELLLSASYSLPKNNEYDLIIRFCFIEGIYKISDVNDLLDLYQCKLFAY